MKKIFNTLLLLCSLISFSFAQKTNEAKEGLFIATFPGRELNTRDTIKVWFKNNIRIYEIQKTFFINNNPKPSKSAIKYSYFNSDQNRFIDYCLFNKNARPITQYYNVDERYSHRKMFLKGNTKGQLYADSNYQSLTDTVINKRKYKQVMFSIDNNNILYCIAKNYQNADFAFNPNLNSVLPGYNAGKTYFFDRLTNSKSQIETYEIVRNYLTPEEKEIFAQWASNTKRNIPFSTYETGESMGLMPPLSTCKPANTAINKDSIISWLNRNSHLELVNKVLQNADFNNLYYENYNKEMFAVVPIIPGVDLLQSNENKIFSFQQIILVIDENDKIRRGDIMVVQPADSSSVKVLPKAAIAAFFLNQKIPQDGTFSSYNLSGKIHFSFKVKDGEILP